MIEKIDKFVIGLVSLFMVIVIIITFSKILQNNKKYQVDIEFTDGSKRTIFFESENRPKVEKNGCVYDYGKKSYVCGCRCIEYKELK